MFAYLLVQSLNLLSFAVTATFSYIFRSAVVILSGISSIMTENPLGI